MFKLRLKKPAELTGLERAMHLGLYPLILVPVGLYIAYTGIAEPKLLNLLIGLFLLTSPFLILLTTRSKAR